MTGAVCPTVEQPIHNTKAAMVAKSQFEGTEPVYLTEAEIALIKGCLQRYHWSEMSSGEERRKIEALPLGVRPDDL